MRTIAVFVENRPFFGALLVHVPLLHALRERAPGARIVLLAPFPHARMLVDAGAADDAVEYRGAFTGALGALARLRPSDVYALRPASRGLDLAVAAARAPHSAGYASWLARGVYRHVVPHDTAIYRPRKYLALVMPREQAMRTPLGAWFRAHAAATAPLPDPARTLAVLPGGGAGEFKRWGVDRFLTLCERLAAEDASLRFAWVLGPQEAEARARLSASPLAARFDVLFDRPLPELAAAAFVVRAAVGNDCGPGHVFQMCGCRFACVMDDHDGTGPRRADEWLDAANRGLVTLPAPGRPITDVGVDAVLDHARAALATPRA